MHEFYQSFLDIIEIEDRAASLDFVIDLLHSNQIDIVTLYEKILAPSLNVMDSLEKKAGSIWKEHVRSSIMRTIIENCYPYVIKERDTFFRFINKKVAVICPAEEYHELGARMVTDFFTIVGYDTYFVGSNTPREELSEILRTGEFDYIAISVSNTYNLVVTKKTIEEIRKYRPDVMIVAGGNAFYQNKRLYKEVGADLLLTSFGDILALAKEDSK